MGGESERRAPADGDEEAALRRAARGGWPIKMVRLGEEPEVDLSTTTTMEERLAFMAELAVFAYALGGHPYPSQAWPEMPCWIQRGEPERSGT